MAERGVEFVDIIGLPRVPDADAKARARVQAQLFLCIKSRLELGRRATARIRESEFKPVPAFEIPKPVKRGKKRARREEVTEKNTEFVAYLGAGVYNAAVRVCYPPGACDVDIAAKVGINPCEAEVHQYLSAFVEKGYTQGFPLHYGERDFLARYRKERKTIVEVAHMLFTELADGNLRTVGMLDDPSSETSLPKLQSVTFQVLHAMRTVNLHSLFLHTDLHPGNVLVHKVDAVGFWSYRMRFTDRSTRVFCVPNHGLVPIVNDYGMSIVRRKQFEDGLVKGTRSVLHDIRHFIERLELVTWANRRIEAGFWFDFVRDELKKAIKQERYKEPDIIGTLMKIIFSEMYVAAEGDPLCSFDDNGGVISGIALPVNLYEKGRCDAKEWFDPDIDAYSSGDDYI